MARVSSRGRAPDLALGRAVASYRAPWLRVTLACALLALAACGGKARAAREALARGDAFLAAGEPQRALTAYAEVRESSLYDAALPRMVAAQEEIGALDRAQTLVDDALKEVPMHVELRLAHARLTAARGEPQHAYEEVHALAQTTPASPELLGLLAAFATTDKERSGAAMRLGTFCELSARRGSEATHVGAEVLLPLASLQAALSQPTAASATRADAQRMGVKQPEIARRVAAAFARCGNGVLAEELLELTARMSPQDAQTWRELTRVRLDMRDWKGASAALDHVQGPAADATITRLLRARLELGLEQPARALPHLRELASRKDVTSDPMLAARVQLALGRALGAQGDVPAAERAMFAALSGDPSLEDAELALAELDLAQNRPARVIERLSLFTEAHPRSAAAFRLLGRAQAALSSYSEAARSFRELVALSPGDPSALELLASALLAGGDAEAAKAQLERALALDPGAAGPLAALSALLIRQGHADQAENLAQIAVNLRGRRPELLTLLGDSLLAQPENPGALEAAERAYREASPDNTPYAPALLALAAIYERKDRIPDALLMLEAALPRVPDPEELWLRVARLQRARGDGAEAKYAYEQVLARKPESAGVLAELARVHAELLRQPSAAQELAERAYALAPEQPSVAETFGWMLLQQGHTDTALPLLREAAAAQPASAEAQYHYAVALMKRGDTRAARAAMERVRDLSPTLADARFAKKALAGAR
jgi:tetratricopeptide (TPR) repeat protein